MGKINSPAELKMMQMELLQGNNSIIRPKDKVVVKVAYATCGIASGATEVMNYMAAELEKRNVDAIVKKTGCMGYCYAEPTIEVSVPGKYPVVFGYVDIKKADEIIEKFIRNSEPVEGVIPVNYHTID
jgi:NADP-reducing hydrogenase subunit HndB